MILFCLTLIIYSFKPVQMVSFSIFPQDESVNLVYSQIWCADIALLNDSVKGHSFLSSHSIIITRTRSSLPKNRKVWDPNYLKCSHPSMGWNKLWHALEINHERSKAVSVWLLLHPLPIFLAVWKLLYLFGDWSTSIPRHLPVRYCNPHITF